MFQTEGNVASAHLHANIPDADAQHAHCNEHLVEHDADTRRVRPMSLPHEPSLEERAEHDMHHATYAAWCPHCVAGQGRQEPHGRRHTDANEHIVYADVLYFTGKGEEVQPSDVNGEMDGGDV